MKKPTNNPVKNSVPVLYRKRIIPEECILLKGDEILYNENNILVTKWNVIKPRKDLHHGYSCYFFDEGYKVSKFYGEDNSFLYYYCDIIDYEQNEINNSIIVTDLLADVIVYPDGFVKVVDLGELVDALNAGGIDIAGIKKSLINLDKLLDIIYSGKLNTLTRYIEQFEAN